MSKAFKSDQKSDESTATEESKTTEGSVTLGDCLTEFENPELLDAENMWYCPSCKTHV